jgi:hypothetical protein
MLFNIFKKEKAETAEILAELCKVSATIPILQKDRDLKKAALLECHVKAMSGDRNEKALKEAKAAAMDEEDRLEAAGIIRNTLLTKLKAALELDRQINIQTCEGKINDLRSNLLPECELRIVMAMAELHAFQEHVTGLKQIPHFETPEKRNLYTSQKAKVKASEGLSEKSIQPAIVGLRNKIMELRAETYTEDYIENLISSTAIEIQEEAA